MVDRSAVGRFRRVVVYFIVILAAILFLTPLWFGFVNAIRNPISTPVMGIPIPAYFSNFVDAITRIPFLRYLRSSVIITGVSVVLQVTCCFIYGFAFARLRAPLKDLWFTVIISLMMVPTFATQIPTYVLFATLKIMDSYLIWVLNGLAGLSYYIFLYRQFLQSIPVELDEAARIDGCSIIKSMLYIFAPCSLPVISVVFMFEFIAQWGDATTPFMFLNEIHWPLAMALSGARYTLPQNPNMILQPLQLAASFLFIVPSFCVYLIGQRNVKQGMITSGLKG